MTRSLEMVIEQVEILKAEEMKIEGASRGKTDMNGEINKEDVCEM